MELDQLRAFVAVAEAGGFTRAAAIVASTQPTLSRQVGALERELGRPLLDRLGRRTTLTDFGVEFLERSRRLLAQADALAASAVVEPGRLTGELRLGVADSVILSRFPRILERYKRRHLDVQVHITSATSPEILGWVRRGALSAGHARALLGLDLESQMVDVAAQVVEELCDDNSECRAESG